MAKKLEDRIKEIKNLTLGSLRRRTGTYSYIEPDDIVIMIKEGLRIPQIAEVYNCSTHTIRRYLRSKYPNFDARKYFKPESKMNNKKVVDAYKKLKSSTKVGKLLGISVVSVLRRLEIAGVERNPRERYDINVKKILELYGKYKNMKSVAKKLDTSCGLLQRRLKDAGIKLDLSKKRTDIPEKEVLELYDNDTSISEIARKYDACFLTVRNIIVDSGREIKSRRGGKRREDITVEKVVEMYGEYRNLSEVARKLKTDIYLIKRRLEEARGNKHYYPFAAQNERTDIPKQEVLDLYDNDESISELARKYNACFTTIKKIIVDSGREIDSKKASPGRTDITPEKAARLYRKHGTVGKVAEKLNSNVNTVRDRLIKAGVKIKKGKGGEPSISGKLEKKIIKDYQSGMSMEKVAIKDGVTTTTVSRALNRNKIKKRKRGDYF